MIKKLQKMQQDMVKAQQELEASTFYGSAGGQMVKVEFFGNKQMKNIFINPEVFDTLEGQERQDLEDMYYKTFDSFSIDFSDDLASSYELTMMYFQHATLVRPQSPLWDTWQELTQAKADGDISAVEFKDLVNRLSDPLLFEFVDPDTGETVTFTDEFQRPNRVRMDSSC